METSQQPSTIPTEGLPDPSDTPLPEQTIDAVKPGNTPDFKPETVDPKADVPNTTTSHAGKDGKDGVHGLLLSFIHATSRGHLGVPQPSEELPLAWVWA